MNVSGNFHLQVFFELAYFKVYIIFSLIFKKEVQMYLKILQSEISWLKWLYSRGWQLITHRFHFGHFPITT